MLTPRPPGHPDLAGRDVADFRTATALRGFCHIAGGEGHWLGEGDGDLALGTPSSRSSGHLSVHSAQQTRPPEMCFLFTACLDLRSCVGEKQRGVSQ